MDEGKPNPTGPKAALLEAAQEELAQACSMGWTALARVTPWGDRFDGFARGDVPVTFERNYVWAEAIGGDILCEVTVFEGESRYDDGARASRLIRRPRAS